MTSPSSDGLSLAPFRALRPQVGPDRLARLLCPPYDVISPSDRTRLLAGDPDNAVAVILPEDGDEPGAPDRYAGAALRLDRELADGLLAVDPDPALYVYEMRDGAGSVTRGLLGAVELRDPADGVILPHENTMAGPVSDRLALMAATQTNSEPIYLVYDGGGAASDIVAGVEAVEPIATASTADGIAHRLWALTDPGAHRAVEEDLRTRRALIADGHHRYATYRELQRSYDAERGPGPWDRGLTLLVDSTSYGPQVHAIHRVLVGAPLDTVIAALQDALTLTPISTTGDALAALDGADCFAVALTDGTRAVVAADRSGRLATEAGAPGEPPALGELDVTVLHRVVVEKLLGIQDTVETVGYAHSVDEAIEHARTSGGTAVLMRPTPVGAVAAVAAAGARMPRKSTLFTPKPASGLVMRRFADQT